MTRQESFERLWASRHDVPAESLVQYRFESRDGYRLPDMAAHYRTHCDTLDSIEIQLPEKWPNEDSGEHMDIGFNRCVDEFQEAIESAGLKVAQ